MDRADSIMGASRLKQKRFHPHRALLHIPERSMMALGFTPAGTVLAICGMQH
jgi:hypothetical protein